MDAWLAALGGMTKIRYPRASEIGIHLNNFGKDYHLTEIYILSEKSKLIPALILQSSQDSSGISYPLPGYAVLSIYPRGL